MLHLHDPAGMYGSEFLKGPSLSSRRVRHAQTAAVLVLEAVMGCRHAVLSAIGKYGPHGSHSSGAAEEARAAAQRRICGCATEQEGKGEVHETDSS